MKPEALRQSQEYWNKAAAKYEQAFTGTLVGKMWRDAVWRELDTGFASGSRVLELNCGTGIDAIHLAQRGLSVVACDISSRMIEVAREEASAAGLMDRLDFRVLPTEQLGTLKTATLFDGAFSNFSGLNCVQDLNAVRRDLARLTKPGARVFLCMLGKFPVWEKLWSLAHADFRTALRPKNSDSTQGGVKVHYASRRELQALFAPQFQLRKWKGIGIAVPPSYMEHWALRYPRITRGLNRVDGVMSDWPLLRALGGCVLLEFQRTTDPE